MNPVLSSLHVTIKLHKPITPLVVALRNNVNLPYTCNVFSAVHPITDLKITEINKCLRLCSFDIEYIYGSVPNIETVDIMTKILKINENEDNAHTGNRNRTKLFFNRNITNKVMD
jgi:hypothetical protein